MKFWRFVSRPYGRRFLVNCEIMVIEIFHNITCLFQFAALGGFILMFGFLAFNGGSMADIVKPGEGHIVALAMINTILCGAFAALIYLVIHYITKGKWTLLLTINACLAGMVSACAGCNRMMPWASVFTGTGSGLAYLLLSKLMIYLKIDDPLDAFAVHAGGGLWGLIAVCIIAEDGIAYRIVDGIDGDGTMIGQAFAQLGWNLVCALAIIIWSTLIMVPVFWILKKIKKFRVLPEIEIKGLDIYKHGEAAYPIHAYGHGWDDVVSEDGTRARAFSDKAECNVFKFQILSVLSQYIFGCITNLRIWIVTKITSKMDTIQG